MAARRDLVAYQGDTFVHQVLFEDANGQPVDVSAFTFASQVRRRATDTTLLASMTVDASQAATGVVTFRLSAAAMAGFEPGVYRYDCDRTDGSGDVLTLTFGRFEVPAEVTR